MKTVIELEFLEVDPGTDYVVRVPDNSSAEDLACIIRSELNNGGVILTNVYIDHIIAYEEV